jgi:hypothetical protein
MSEPFAVAAAGLQTRALALVAAAFACPGESGEAGAFRLCLTSLTDYLKIHMDGKRCRLSHSPLR